MYKNKRFYVFLIFSLLLTACSSSGENTSTSTDLTVPYECTLSTQENADGTLALAFTFKNISDSGIILDYPSNCFYDYQILNADDDVVYTWSDNQTFVQQTYEKAFDSEAFITYQETYPMTDSEGNSLPAGSYTVDFYTQFNLDDIPQDVHQTSTFTVS